MTNKYIEAEIVPAACGGGGSFSVGASFRLGILKDWDIHIGISKETGKSLFLACPVENKYKEYADALKLHFGYVTLT